MNTPHKYVSVRLLPPASHDVKGRRLNAPGIEPTSTDGNGNVIAFDLNEYWPLLKLAHAYSGMRPIIIENDDDFEKLRDLMKAIDSPVAAMMRETLMQEMLEDVGVSDKIKIIYMDNETETA